ncbi:MULTISPECIES: efflux RND transporter periplasmic adaptor subunit [Bacillus]|uniref:efflux RND transporter periplasmic adaptor subunit n=1 Tax=Bacillus TaxID=1386 RepID=UPI0022E2AFEC|nr:HlyD family efflux transporter periplasmic adaptor subunit [Bacillus smithii]
MRKTTRNMIIAVLCACLIAGNLYLIFKKDSKIEKTQWIDKWARVKIGNLAETFHTSGVITPQEEYPVYFDPSMGQFSKFLVEKGDKVSPGTELFQYSPAEIEEERAKWLAEKEQAQREIDLVTEEVQKLQNIQSSLKSSDQTPSAAEVTVKSQILEQQAEIGKLQEEVKKYDTLLRELDQRKQQLTVKSPYAGYVEKIDDRLNNPIITIRSLKPAVQGVLNEKQRKKVTEGLKVKVSVDTKKKQYTGKIIKVDSYPENEPSVHKNSYYPFKAQLFNVKDSNEPLLPGSKANITIITKESLSTLMVPSSSVFQDHKKNYVLVLNREGIVEKREITKGIHVGQKQEIIRGVKQGEAVLPHPKDIQKVNSPFITPLKFSDTDKKAIQNVRKKDMLLYFMLGVLS